LLLVSLGIGGGAGLLSYRAAGADPEKKDPVRAADPPPPGGERTGAEEKARLQEEQLRRAEKTLAELTKEALREEDDWHALQRELQNELIRAEEELRLKQRQQDAQRQREAEAVDRARKEVSSMELWLKNHEAQVRQTLHVMTGDARRKFEDDEAAR